MRGHLHVRRALDKAAAGLACVAALALSDCSTLPAAGPTTAEVVDQAVKDGKVQFEILDVDDGVIKTLQSQPVASFHSRFGRDGIPPEPRIGTGDSIAISIWEAGGNGLFAQITTVNGIPTGARPATIPEQIVSQDGDISIPFDGRVKVAGRTPFEVQQGIQRRLQGKAVNPQVIVTVSKSIANSVTISGEVVNGAMVPLSPHGERLLDVIAAAGGSHAPTYETFVKLSRHGDTVTIPLAQLVDDPSENIYAWPGDTITLVRAPQVFEAFGATGRNAEIPFGSEKISLAQALGKSSGLLDERADAAGVFLFRYEPPSLVSALTKTPSPKDQAASVPVVYHLDLSDAKSYFLAQQFALQDKDVVYVANARSNQIEKLFQLLGTLTNPIVTGFVVKNSAN